MTDSSELSPALQETFRKYSSLGAMVKAGDTPALDLVLTYYQQHPDPKRNVKAEVLSQMLLEGAGLMKPEVAQVLLKHGAGLDDRKNDIDAAQAALLAKNPTLLYFFLDQKLIDVEHVARDGTTLLMLALRTEQYDLADRLKERGADINRRMLMFTGGDSPLHLAASQGSFQSVIWLVENGADPTAVNTYGKLACEMIPSMDRASQEWDMDAMFDCLEDYRESREQGQAFEIPLRMREMAHMENTPMTQMEAQMKALGAMAEEEAKQQTVIAPQKKKVGF